MSMTATRCFPEAMSRVKVIHVTLATNVEQKMRVIQMMCAKRKMDAIQMMDASRATVVRQEVQAVMVAVLKMPAVLMIPVFKMIMRNRQIESKSRQQGALLLQSM